jgi:Tfp pilus assembly protein PilF
MVSEGKKQEALAKLQLLAAEDRFDPRGFYNIANAFARLDATDSAVSAYRKAIAQRKGRYARASNNLGVILLRQGFWDQAYDAFLDALRTENFHYAEASYNLGRLYAARGEMDRASREWRRAVSVDPKHHGAAQALASVRSPSLAAPE